MTRCFSSIHAAASVVILWFGKRLTHLPQLLPLERAFIAFIRLQNSIVTLSCMFRYDVRLDQGMRAMPQVCLASKRVITKLRAKYANATRW